MASTVSYFVTIAIALMVAESSAQQTCPANQVWSECPKLESCRNTCLQPNGPEVCLTVCDEPACVCIEGYVLSRDGDCIPATECKNTCGGDNAVWNECPRPQTCRPTCDQPNGPATCTQQCDTPVCTCNEGYVLKDGQCIPKAECPQPCGENERWSVCPWLEKCRETCDKPQLSPCERICDTPTCICQDGFVLNKDKKCVALSQCPSA